METPNEARIRLGARQRELLTELEQVQRQLEQVQRQLDQLETKVVVSAWWYAPSGPRGRGTVYHTGTDRRCPLRSPNGRPGSPVEISLYEALRAELNPCGKCKPATAPANVSASAAKP